MSDRSEERWARLWTRLGARGDPAPVYRDLVRRYSEPHRSYHTIAHIEQCLDEYEPARDLARAPEAVEMAIWFHDAVYETRAHDNEERSAGLAVETINRAGLSPGLATTVARLIAASRHQAAPEDPDAQVFVDVDLSILGQREDRFEEYERQVRHEYSWVPESIFASRRAALLRSLLGRETLYATVFFRERYEAQARRNLSRSIERLERH